MHASLQTARVTKWRIPALALDHSFRELAADGALNREGIALWAGRLGQANANVAEITHVVLLRGAGIRRLHGFIQISASLLNDVTDCLGDIGRGVYLVGQIHGHPPDSSVDLSPTDIRYGITVQDYLSVVAPHYGMMPGTEIIHCGVHLYDRPIWHRQHPLEVKQHITITSLPCEVITVGDSRDAFNPQDDAPTSSRSNDPTSPRTIARGGSLDVRG